jgi:transcriptional regulator with XRE-family HTH domain
MGFSQEKLAEHTGLSAQTISDIEGCRTWVSENTLVKLSNALKTEIFQLLTPVIGENSENLELLPLKIEKLREIMKIDIDKRLDQFLFQGNTA